MKPYNKIMYFKTTKKLTLIFLFISFFAFSQKQKLPINPNGDIDPIGELKDGTLQILLESQINANAQWKSLVRRKKLSIGIVDLSDISNVKYAGINTEACY